MRKNKQEAIKLRTLGKSYNQIKKELGIPKSTISDWLSHLEWSRNIRRKNDENIRKEHTIRIVHLSKIRGKNLNLLYIEAEREAKLELEFLKYEPLFIAGVMLYWGEGDKKSKNHVRIANSDPLIIRIFLAFLNKFNIGNSKIAASLLIYPDLEEQKVLDFWKNEAGLSNIHFTKTQVIQGRHKNNRLSNGVCYLTVSSTFLKRKMNIWIKNLAEDLLDDDSKKV